MSMSIPEERLEQRFQDDLCRVEFANFPSTIKVFQGMYFPFLPIEDRTFDLISAMSVFTHIDETETSWLLELWRILKPGGIAVVTIHNEDTWLNMSPSFVRWWSGTAQT